jgi:hypothetical protein
VALPAALTAPRGTLLFGELHGTRELPAFIGRVVATLAATQPVVLALEIRSDQAPSIPAFLASDGGPAARAALLRDPWWTGVWQDGRQSVAMVELLDTARRLRADGKRLDVVCFDSVRPPGAELDAEQREATMARTLVALRAARPDATLVIHGGNLHTRRTGASFNPGFAWMAMRMASAGLAFTTLDARYPDGTAWVCGSADPQDCGARFIAGREVKNVSPGIHLEPAADGSFDGRYDVAALTASPPAAFPERAPSDAELAALLASPDAQR